MLTFPYLRKGNQFFPVVDVTFLVPKRPLAIKALVDSGATFSVFRAEVLEYLGIPLSNGKPIYLEGIGGRILGYRHRIPVQVGTKRFPLSIIFSQEITVSFNLLGRDNFFREFLVIFDERNRFVRLKGHHKIR